MYIVALGRFFPYIQTLFTTSLGFQLFVYCFGSAYIKTTELLVAVDEVVVAVCSEHPAAVAAVLASLIPEGLVSKEVAPESNTKLHKTKCY